MTLVLACDIGGSHFRLGLVDEEGNVPHDVTLASPAEGDDGSIAPETWWDRFTDAAEQLARAAPDAFAGAAAVAVCGVTRTQVFLDAAGTPVHPAITFRDARAAEIAEELRARLDPVHPEAAHVNAFHPLARLAWLKRHAPAAYGRLAWVVDPKDFINARLTGVVASDSVSAGRLAACAASAEAGSLFAAAGLSEAVLPPLLAPGATVGIVGATLGGALARLAGRPVVCGSHDTWAAVVGLGAMRPGFAYNISGTTEVLGLMSPADATADGLLTIDWGGGLNQIGGPGQNGADTARWLAELLTRWRGEPVDVPATFETLLAQPRDRAPVLFLPLLQGERTPYWNPSMRGAFLGLNRRHGAGDLAWALLEGIALLNRDVLTRAETAAGIACSEIRFGGGAAANRLWAQVKADVCDRPVVVGTAGEPGLVGAAALAQVAAGTFASLEAAQARMARPDRRYLPRADRRPFYDVLFGQFRRAVAELAPLSADLAHLETPI